MPRYLQSVGAALPLGDGDVAHELADAFADLHRRAPSLKAFVSYYPRRDLPGRCVAIQTVFHDLPDPMIENDGEAAEQFARDLHDHFFAPGMLFEVRQVWQLEGDRPRLIEATVELTDEFERLMERNVPKSMFGDADVERITCDIARGGHFRPFGGGARRGLLWVDRSFGIGQARPWSAAYRLRPTREFDTDLAPELIEALREFATRF